MNTRNLFLSLTCCLVVQYVFSTPVRFSPVVQVVQSELAMPSLRETALLNNSYRCFNSRPQTCPVRDVLDAQSERSIKPASAERYAKQNVQEMHLNEMSRSRVGNSAGAVAEKIAKEFIGKAP